MGLIFHILSQLMVVQEAECNWIRLLGLFRHHSRNKSTFFAPVVFEAKTPIAVVSK